MQILSPDLQLTYAKREWSEKRASWRVVIFLNLVRNVNEVLEHMVVEMDDLPYPQSYSDDSDEDLQVQVRSVKTLPPLKFKEKHRQLRIRLAPLQQVQRVLEQQLGAASMEIYDASAAPFKAADPLDRGAPAELSVNSLDGLRSALDKSRDGQGNRPEASNATNNVPKVVEEEIAKIITNCREDIKSLWDDPVVKQVLSRRKARIEDAPGLCVSFIVTRMIAQLLYSFINDIERIAVNNYMPTDDDVIRARLRTLGIQEYRLIFDHGVYNQIFFLAVIITYHQVEWLGKSGGSTMWEEQGAL